MTETPTTCRHGRSLALMFGERECLECGHVATATCLRCEANPGDNDHCVYDGSPHPWHRCGGIVAPDSDCPTAE